MISLVPTSGSRVTGQSIVRAAGRVPAPWSQGIVSLGRGSTIQSGFLALSLLIPDRFVRPRLSLSRHGGLSGGLRPAQPHLLGTPLRASRLCLGRPNRQLVAESRPVSFSRAIWPSANIVWCPSPRGLVVFGPSFALLDPLGDPSRVNPSRPDRFRQGGPPRRQRRIGLSRFLLPDTARLRARPTRPDPAGSESH